MMGAALGLAGCASKFKSYHGPEVTRIQVFKGARIMQLLSGSAVLKSYNFELGFAPTEHKQIEGDGRTPEGAYYIDRRNPNSRYHLSLGISYPNINDINKARAMDKQPGGEIFIHGTPSLYAGQDDWTWGCIAVTNADIEEIYAMVNDGTKIFIYP
jgi:murein L,D-transpeptidase YafK